MSLRYSSLRLNLKAPFSSLEKPRGDQSPLGFKPSQPSNAAGQSAPPRRHAILGLRCPQEQAYEVIIREIPEALKLQHGLTQVVYDGELFIVMAPSRAAVDAAVTDLERHCRSFLPQAEASVNSGSAEDLKNVKFSRSLKFTGEPECLFCGRVFQRGDRVRRTACLHVFHTECLKPWLAVKKVCPLDKMPI